MTDAHHGEVRLRALLDSEHVSPATRAALDDRLAPLNRPPDPPIFAVDERATLRAAADRLFPAVDGTPTPDLALVLERKLAAGDGKGWRYASLPDDVTTVRRLLGLLDRTSEELHAMPFAALGDNRRDALLTLVQRGELGGSEAFDTARAFEELLAALTECYASDPLVQVAFGYVGFADIPSWERIGLGERDDREIGPAGVVDG